MNPQEVAACSTPCDSLSLFPSLSPHCGRNRCIDREDCWCCGGWLADFEGGYRLVPDPVKKAFQEAGDYPTN